MQQNSTIVIVLSSAVEVMELGGLAGMTALTMGLGQDRATKAKEIVAEESNGTGKLIFTPKRNTGSKKQGCRAGS